MESEGVNLAFRKVDNSAAFVDCGGRGGEGGDLAFRKVHDVVALSNVRGGPGIALRLGPTLWLC